MEGKIEGKKVRIQVRTAHGIYVGEFVIPPMRNRLSDALNDDQRMFISLTDVVVDEKERAPFISINKNHIESVTEL